MLKIAYSPIYKYPLPEGHRFPMMKYELLAEQLIYEGSVTDANFFHPEQLTIEELLTTHTSEYLSKLENLSLNRKEERDIGFPITKLLIERGKHIAKGTLDCARFARTYGVSLNIAGGTHHSFKNRGEGFCVFNDIALAANILLHNKEVQKILIVDLDVHQGNGTASIFKDDNRVFTFSMHGAKNYPLRKEKSDLDIELADKTGNKEYQRILSETLPGLIEKVRPNLIFYLSGVDILSTDKLGRLAISKSGCKERDQYVLKKCKEYNIPIAITMGGGYSKKISDIVEAHANTFRSALEIYF